MEELKYGEFRKELIEQLLKNYPEGAEEIKLNKNNTTKDGIRLITSSQVSPVFYIDELYEDYLSGRTVSQCVDGITAAARQVMPDTTAATEMFNDYKAAEPNIIAQLVNTYDNRELLSTVPHRRFHDLSVIYRIMIDDSNGFNMSAVLSDSLCKMYGVTEEQLYDTAIKNMTEGKFKAETVSLGDLIPMFDEPEVPHMVILRTRNTDYGASQLLIPDSVQAAADKVLGGKDGEVLLLPSSIHEVIVVKVSASVLEHAEMVRSINEAEVDVTERLSNQAYGYDTGRKQVVQLTDTPYKSVIEPGKDFRLNEKAEPERQQ